MSGGDRLRVRGSLGREAPGCRRPGSSALPPCQRLCPGLLGSCLLRLNGSHARYLGVASGLTRRPSYLWGVSVSFWVWGEQERGPPAAATRLLCACRFRSRRRVRQAMAALRPSGCRADRRSRRVPFRGPQVFLGCVLQARCAPLRRRMAGARLGRVLRLPLSLPGLALPVVLSRPQVRPPGGEGPDNPRVPSFVPCTPALSSPCCQSGNFL